MKIERCSRDRLVVESLISLVQGSADRAPLKLLVFLEHISSEVVGPDLVTTNPAIIHLVLPHICWLLDSILKAVFTLLLSQIETSLNHHLIFQVVI